MLRTCFAVCSHAGKERETLTELECKVSFVLDRQVFIYITCPVINANYNYSR